jgi:AcrR family transcriptional regulator
MSPKVTEDYSDFRRQQILQATWDSFAEKGYRETTIRDIAGSLGLSTGVVYSYFDSKDQIIDALQEMSAQSNQRMVEQLAHKETLSEAVKELFDYLGKCCSEEEFRKSAKGNISIWAEALKRESFKTAFVSHHDQFLEGISSIAKKGLAAGELKAGFDPQTFASLLMALILGLHVQAGLLDSVYSSDYMERIRDLFLNSVLRSKGGTP